ncbi:uncharacterized protein LOC115628778 isoform X2 [Scaptodrosophila lebanonensis]|uniref:ubiquitinyl hydrolase 1 n=1 Tax=Drosophila lebanonensis TaxID=7225 RepID=A0A6J2TXK9_DROLE|nr:uncharacterized protein LOC115628778 isoform X2 [Scaptodrosophila lebanonensis]
MGTKEQQQNDGDAAVPVPAAGATHRNATTTTLATTPTQKIVEEEQQQSNTSTAEQQQQQEQTDQKSKTLSSQPTHVVTIAATTATPTPTTPQVLIIPATQASTLATNAAKKIRRAFSMPRNPFGWSRKLKTAMSSKEGSGGSGGGGSSTAISSCVSGARGRSGSIISLNSYDDAIMCKDTNGNRSTQAVNNTSMSNNIRNSTSNNNNNSSSNNNKRAAGNHARVLRRSSFRKFLNRIAQHLSATVNVGANKHGQAAMTTAGAERVPPIGGYQWPPDQTPGVMGLKNHGNTCFMNAVLQCLSHTDILAEYFVLDQYKADLKRRNKINSRKFGTKGELTEQLANVLKALWTCKNESDHSTSFKAVVDRYGTQFRSSTQHDAQEFLFWLLDKVHEDLNTASKRRYKSIKNSYGRSDEIIAAETLANHIRCNNSFVQAVFQAQFRSSLTCPRCKKQSNTFDPFHCISVQLPQLSQQTIFVTVVYAASRSSQKPRQLKMGLRVPAGSPIVALREQLQTDTGIAAGRMVLVDLNAEGFTRVFYDSQPVETLSSIENIYCIEVPEPSKGTEANTKTMSIPPKATPLTSKEGTEKSVAPPTTIPAPAPAHSADLLLLVANVHRHKKSVEDIGKDTPKTMPESCERFGAPFSMKAPRDCSYTDLQKRMLREMSALLKPEVFAYTTPLTDMFKIRLQDPSADPDTYLEQVEHPLLTEMIDMALSVLSTEAGPQHIKVLLEWSMPEAYFADMQQLEDVVVEHESVARLNASKFNNSAALTLEQCLEHYTKAETLSAEDAWRCPHCQQYLPVVKTLGLWSLPDILVVHFKRFRQHQVKGPQAAKLTTMVKFPLNAFDMSPHLARGVNESNSSMALDPLSASSNYRANPWKKTRSNDSRSSTLNSRGEQKDTRYDLYAVCYHQGDTLETGHYTAACKNPYDRQWYKFDDQRVSKVPEDAIEEEIINNEAYMLFYQRRSVDAGECSGSSSNSGDHWVSRIAPTPASKDNKDVIKLEATNGNSESVEPVALLPEKAQSKPVAIPKVGCEIDEVTNAVEAAVMEIPEPPATKTHELLNIEEIAFADADGDASERDGHEDVKIKAEISAETALPENTAVVAAIDDCAQIFAMDEDCTEINELPLTANERSSPTKLIVEPNTQSVSDPVIESLTNGHAASPTLSASTSSSSSTSLSSRSSPRSLSTSVHAASTLQTKFNGHMSSASVAASVMLNGNGNNSSHANAATQQLSSSLKSYCGGAGGHELQLSRHALHNHNHCNHNYNNWHGSRSSVSAVENSTAHTQHQATAASLSLRHSFSTSSNYKLRECSETLCSLLRNSANTCSKDTLLFIDQQSHHHRGAAGLLEDDDDTYMGRSLWISPVTPHKLITVSPKN